jgi:hypothetical protein
MLVIERDLRKKASVIRWVKISGQNIERDKIEREDVKEAKRAASWVEFIESKESIVIGEEDEWIEEGTWVKEDEVGSTEWIEDKWVYT